MKHEPFLAYACMQLSVHSDNHTLANTFPAKWSYLTSEQSCYSLQNERGD